MASEWWCPQTSQRCPSFGGHHVFYRLSVLFSFNCFLIHLFLEAFGSFRMPEIWNKENFFHFWFQSSASLADQDFTLQICMSYLCWSREAVHTFHSFFVSFFFFWQVLLNYLPIKWKNNFIKSSDYVKFILLLGLQIFYSLLGNLL